MILSLLAPALLAATPSAGPALTAQTMRSGGPLTADQRALRFDHADLAFEILPEVQALNGVATLTFTATAPITVLPIDLDRDLAISRIAIDGAPLPRTAWTNSEGRLFITLPRPLAAGGKVTVRIAYGGRPHVAVNPPWDDGMVWSKTPQGRTWFATTAEGYGCDLFWPCLDFPTGEPARVDLHVTIPAGLKAPSNGRLVSVDRLPGGRTRWNWTARQPNTYGIALNVGPYEEITAPYRSRAGTTVPMTYWYLPGERAQAERLFAEFAPTLDFFESVIGPYPFADEKLGVVETPHKGMEHQTINAYGNAYAKAPEGFDWLFHHELSHEWFGNQMTAADWDDYWLHEGFASYMQPLYARWREGEARYDVLMDAQRNRIVAAVPLVSGRSRTEEEVYETAKGGPGTDIYYRGSWTLHTLRWLIGDAPFFAATRELVYGTATPSGLAAPRYARTADFVTAAQRASGRDLAWFFDAYLKRGPLPELVVARTGDTLTLEWRAGGAFPMPVEIAVDGTVRRIDMPEGRAILALPKSAHLVVDPVARVLKRSIAIEEYQAWQTRPK